MKSILSRNLFTQGKLQPGGLLIEDGKILRVFSANDRPKGVAIEDYGDLFVIPGLVDTHVHINEPGRTDWEGFTTATKAAAAGGITTVIDMPLNCIPVTTSQTALNEKLEAVKDQLWVDCGFHGGVIPGNENELAPMMEKGIHSFKAFMIDSGIEEFPASSLDDLEKAMKVMAEKKMPLLVHAEMESELASEVASKTQSNASELESYAKFLDSRPTLWENQAIASIIDLCRKTGCPIHIVHLSSSEALSLIANAKAEGLPVTAETCPHYLSLCSEEIPDGDARFKCCPPIRQRANQELLWKGLCEGVIDFVVSDHSPCTPHLKLLEERNLKEAWGGISSLQFGLALIWEEVQKRNLGVKEVVTWLCEKPARLVGLQSQKGQLAEGFDADFVVWDPNKKFTLDVNSIVYKHKLTPYEGRELSGEVQKTFVRGELVYDKRQAGLFSNEPLGKALL